MAVLPGRPYRPRDKAAAEAGVLVTERRVLAPLRKRQFFSLAELNAAIAEQVRLVNDRPFRALASSRRQLFAKLERAALQPLPATPYEFAIWKSATTVNIDTTSSSTRGSTQSRTDWCASTSTCARPRRPWRSSIAVGASPAMCASTVGGASSPSRSTCPRRIARTWNGHRRS